MTAQGVSPRHDHEAGRVSFLELFFDLVFVFAITQVSHLLLEHLTWSGAGKTVFMLIAVWWTWITALWWSEWVAPQARSIRLAIVAVMVACMLMAIAIPEAFDARGLLFAAAYLAARFLMLAVAFVALPRRDYRRLAAGSVWIVAAAALWIAGALLDDETRVVLWCGALAVDVAGPLLNYRTPWLGEYRLADEEISTSHLVERFQLFVILVLGESIVLTGATAATKEMTAARITAIVVAVLVTAALWALYFGRDERRTQDLIAGRDGSGHHLVRDVFTYLHVPIVAGLVVVAVANEIVIAHPDDELTGAELLALAAGPVLFLLGAAAAAFRVVGTLPRRKLVAAVLVVCTALLGIELPALAAWSVTLGVLAALLVAERATAADAAGRS